MDNATHYKFTGTYLAISLILILIATLRICHKPKTIFLAHTTTMPTFVKPAIPSLWPSLHSRGGGVTANVVADLQPPPNLSDSQMVINAYTGCINAELGNLRK